MQTFPYADQNSGSDRFSCRNVSVFWVSDARTITRTYTHTRTLRIAKARWWKTKRNNMAWKDQNSWLLHAPKISTGTTRGGDMRRGQKTQLATRQGWNFFWNFLHSSMSNVPWLVEKSHWQQNKYFIRPIATFPLNYILMLDRRVEASDKSRQITHGAPTSCFFFYSFKTSCDWLNRYDLNSLAYHLLDINLRTGGVLSREVGGHSGKVLLSWRRS